MEYDSQDAIEGFQAEIFHRVSIAMNAPFEFRPGTTIDGGLTPTYKNSEVRLTKLKAYGNTDNLLTDSKDKEELEEQKITKKKRTASILEIQK